VCKVSLKLIAKHKERGREKVMKQKKRNKNKKRERNDVQKQIIFSRGKKV
jgi:hypothetical protein